MRVAAALLVAALVACERMVFEPPSSVCTTLGAQCQLDRGPLGVCESASCPPGGTPPCFTCISQH